MSKIYIRLAGSQKTKSGGLISSGKLTELFYQNDFVICEIYFGSFLSCLLVYLKILLRLYKFKSTIFLCELRYNNSFKDFIKIALNRYILSSYVNHHKDIKTVIMDGLLPVGYSFFNNFSKVRFVSFIRSSPSCFSFASPNLKIKFFREQLNFSDAFICASREVLLKWREVLNEYKKRCFRISVPISEANKFELNNPLKLADDKLNVVIIVGAIGPRKGVFGFLRSLQHSEVRNKIIVHILGQDREKTDLKSFDFDIAIYGFSNFDFQLSLEQMSSVKNIIRVFPSYSECYSRVQVEGLISNDPCIFKSASFDSDFLKYTDLSSIAHSHDEIVVKLEKIVLGEAVTSEYKPKFQINLEHYNIDFCENFEKLINYVD